MNIVILAGGFGTRLQSVVKDVPKPMADINGIPFLELLIREVLFCDPENIILCVSYLKDVIKNYFGNNFLGVPILYSEETEPLGTGGAIKQAFELFNLKEAVVLNGDTYVKTNYQDFIQKTENEKLAVLLKQVDDASRYGCVEVKNDRIVSMIEKDSKSVSGLINAGIYKIRCDLFTDDLPKKFSFEKDLLEPRIKELKPLYIKADDYFIDIGIPESYIQACNELKDVIFGKPVKKALFLDRDGVINIDKHHLYKIEDCEFIDGIFDLCCDYKSKGYEIVIVTNQAGIGKGLYTEEDYFKLRDFIHNKFKEHNCPVTAEYFCPYHIDGFGKYKKNSFYRKPNAGMILKAAKDLSVDLTQSVLIGDKESDIIAGKTAGVGKTILLDGKINLKSLIELENIL